ncbi:hypothetical protein D1007_45934 [Hordeum vulgare]|nr:hypothetical protein D1007_45934 [Hordeum vulgare]
MKQQPPSMDEKDDPAFKPDDLDLDREGSKLRGSCSSCASMFDKYACAYKVQEVNDSLDYVHKSAPNEELVKGTTREDDVGDSKTSRRSVEDVAPSSEKDIGIAMRV